MKGYHGIEKLETQTVALYRNVLLPENSPAFFSAGTL